MPPKKPIFALVSDEARGKDQSEDIDGVTMTWKPRRVPDTVFNSDPSDHIPQERLLESLSNTYALTVNERWHLSGCDRCARLLNVLRQLRDVRLGRATHTLRSRFV
jgi:hypothetical protein